MVVDAKGPEAVYKITARMPTSCPVSLVSAPCQSFSSTISSRPSAALRTAGVRTDGGAPGPITKRGLCDEGAGAQFFNPRRGMGHSAISGRCVSDGSTVG